ncbi:MAG: lysophospholipid acyltransferase family protein [Planctomycetota bacterium]
MLLWILIPVLILTLLVGLALLEGALRRNPRGGYEAGALFLFGRTYARLVHNLRVRGGDRIPAEREPGPLIVVCNHTAGLDPVVVQCPCPFYIRWMMAEDMRAPQLEWFWTWWGIFFVDRAKRTPGGFKSAIRHLRAGGVVGIFPEGAIERPPRQLLPFLPGLGVLIKKSHARVLCVTIDGTPQYDPAWASLWHTSQTVVHFRELIDYAESDLGPAEIVEDLERRFAIWTNWPRNEDMESLVPDPDRVIPYGGLKAE